MKVLGLLAFATVFLLSSAYADRDRGRHSSLLDPEDRRHGEALQRRKPPGKPPGPELMVNDLYQDPNLGQLLADEETKKVYLAPDKKHSHLYWDDQGMDKKQKRVANGDYNVNNGEESQQERSRSLRPE